MHLHLIGNEMSYSEHDDELQTTKFIADQLVQLISFIIAVDTRLYCYLTVNGLK